MLSIVKTFEKTELTFITAIESAIDAHLAFAAAIAKTMSAQDFMLDPAFTEFCYKNGIYIDVY